MIKKEIDWKILLGNVRFMAMERARKDPELKRKLGPILEERAKFLDELTAKEKEIINYYVKYYTDQIMTERVKQEETLQQMLKMEMQERKKKKP